MTTQTKTLMQGTATLNLMGATSNPERFKNLLHPQTIIDAKINFLTCEGLTISVDILEFLNLKWEAVE